MGPSTYMAVSKFTTYDIDPLTQRSRSPIRSLGVNGRLRG